MLRGLEQWNSSNRRSVQVKSTWYVLCVEKCMSHYKCMEVHFQWSLMSNIIQHISFNLVAL